MAAIWSGRCITTTPTPELEVTLPEDAILDVLEQSTNCTPIHEQTRTYFNAPQQQPSRQMSTVWNCRLTHFVVIDDEKSAHWKLGFHLSLSETHVEHMFVKILRSTVENISDIDVAHKVLRATRLKHERWCRTTCVTGKLTWKMAVVALAVTLAAATFGSCEVVSVIQGSACSTLGSSIETMGMISLLRLVCNNRSPRVPQPILDINVFNYTIDQGTQNLRDSLDNLTQSYLAVEDMLKNGILEVVIQKKIPSKGQGIDNSAVPGHIAQVRDDHLLPQFITAETLIGTREYGRMFDSKKWEQQLEPGLVQIGYFVWCKGCSYCSNLEQSAGGQPNCHSFLVVSRSYDFRMKKVPVVKKSWGGLRQTTEYEPLPMTAELKKMISEYLDFQLVTELLKEIQPYTLLQLGNPSG